MNLKKFILLPLAALVLAGCGPDIIPPEGVTVTAAETTLELGDTTTVTAALTPADAKAEITWSSSDTEVATVDATGKVTAVGLGEVEITAHAVSDEKIVRGSVELAVNPDVEAVLASIATEIAVTGTASLVAPEGSLGTFGFDTYVNVNEGEEQWFHTSEGSTYSYFADEDGYLVDYVLDNHNEIQTISYTSGGNPVLADGYITYSFGVVTASEVVVTTPTQLDVQIGEEHGAVELATELSGYIADVTDTVTINLNKDGSVASLTVVGHGSVEIEGAMTNYVNTVEATVTTKEAVGAPRKTPMPEITGDDAAIVNSFLTALDNGNYTMEIIDGGKPAGVVEISDDAVVVAGTIFYNVEGDGVYQVVVDDSTDPVSLIAQSDAPIAATISEMLIPVDFSADLFVPRGNGVYGLAGGLTSNVLLGLDPSLPFYSGGDLLITNISSVEISLTVEGTTVTAATITYDYDYYGLGLILDTLTLNLTNFGTTTFEYADGTFVELVIEDWNEVLGQDGWYETAVTNLGEEIAGTVPYVTASWYGYADPDANEYGVQSSFETEEEAQALFTQIETTLAGAGWVKSESLVDGYDTPVYTKEGSTIYVATSVFEASTGGFVCDIIFWPASEFIPKTTWSEVDAEWAASVNEALGGNIDSVPFVDLDWSVYNDSYYGIIAESAYLDSFATAEAQAAEMVAALTTAGWSLDEGLCDADGNPVYTLSGNPIAVAVNPVNFYDYFYYVEVVFTAYSDATVPTVATTWSEYDADFATEMEAAGIDVDVTPFLDAEWGCDASTSSAYVYTDPTTAQEIYDAYVALLVEAGWTATGEADENGITTYANPDTNVTIGVQLDVRTDTVAYVNLYWGTSAAVTE